MIVHQSSRLHVRICDCWANEAESPLLEILAQCLGFGGSRWNLSRSLPAADFGLPVDEPPAVGVKAAELCLDFEKRTSIAHRGLDLRPRTEDLPKPVLLDGLIDRYLDHLATRSFTPMTSKKLKQLIANFVEHRPPVAGGCPILNTAIDADDGNTVLRARVAKALRSWLSRLQVIVEQAREHRETRPGVDAKAVATLIVASLEGALMMSRLQRNDEALRCVQSHLNRYLDSEVAARDEGNVAIVSGRSARRPAIHVR